MAPPVPWRRKIIGHVHKYMGNALYQLNKSLGKIKLKTINWGGRAADQGSNYGHDIRGNGQSHVQALFYTVTLLMNIHDTICDRSWYKYLHASKGENSTTSIPPCSHGKE